MAETDFAVHTRGACLSCGNKLCVCVYCKGRKWCGLGSLIFPMLSSCHWNTIMKCSKYKKKEEDHASGLRTDNDPCRVAEVVDSVNES